MGRVMASFVFFPAYYIVGLPIAYLAVLVGGIPAIHYLHKTNRFEPRHFAATGAMVGLLPLAAMFFWSLGWAVMYSRPLIGSRGVIPELLASSKTLLWCLMFMAGGAASGALYRKIARA